MKKQSSIKTLVEKIPTGILKQAKKAFLGKKASMPSAPYD